MLKKLLMFAITSGLAAKLYKRYVEKQDQRHRARRQSPAAGRNASGLRKRSRPELFVKRGA
jgi:membrane protein implicated in regulation of membrane protease activity